MMKLLEFNFRIQYKKGVENKVADALTRIPLQCSAISIVTPMWAQELVDSYMQDPVMLKLQEQVLLQSSDQPSQYTMHGGKLRYKGRIMVGNVLALKTKLL